MISKVIGILGVAVCGLAGLLVLIHGGRPHSLSAPASSDGGQGEASLVVGSGAAMVYEFGEVDAGEAITHTFAVQNNRHEVLRIERGAVSCAACLQLKSMPSTVPPGGDGKVEASLDTTHKKGPVEVSIRLETNDPNRRVITLIIRGTVRAVWSEPAFVELGPIGGPEGQPALVRLMSVGYRQAALKGLTSSGRLDCKIIRGKLIGQPEDGRAALGWIEVTPVAAPDGHSALHVDVSTERGTRAVTIPVYGGDRVAPAAGPRN